MSTNRNKKFFKATTVVLLVAFLFFCRGGSLGPSIFTNGNIHTGHAAAMQMDADVDTNTPACCDVESPLNSAMHETAYFVSAAPDVFKLLAALFLFVSLFLIKLHRIFLWTNQTNRHSLMIRMRHGSHRIFEPLLQLFRLGILHPKTW